MTRDKAIACAKMSINNIEYQMKFNPKDTDTEMKDIRDVLKAFIETDRKYEALKITSNIKQEPTE